MNQNLSNESSNESNSINIREEIEKYLIHWKWVLFSIILCFSLAFLFLKTKVNIYTTNASILVKEDDGASSELKIFQDISSLGIGAENNVYDEIQILKSRSLFLEVVKKLNLTYEVFQDDGLKKIEKINNLPFKCKVLSSKEYTHNIDTIINIKVLDELRFSYKVEESEKEDIEYFGEKINIGDGEILLTPTNISFNDSLNNSYDIVFSSLDKVIERYNKIISVVSADKNSNIIRLSMNHPVKEKAELILNTLIKVYNQRSIADKNEISKKTGKFIENRLIAVNSDLDKIDKIEEKYKKDKQITDIQFQSEIFVGNKSDNEEAIFKKYTELNIVNYIIENIIIQNDDFQLLPAGVGSDNNIQLGLAVTNFNDLLLERNRLLRYSSLENPVVQNLNEELFNLRSNIEKSLRNTKEQLEISLNSLEKKDKEFDSRITEIPKQAREYRSILRKQNIIAELYSYLLQKKEENSISMAVTVANFKVINKAYSFRNPTAPNKYVVLLGGIVIGLVIPLGVIYLIGLLDTKFHTKHDVEKVVSVPLIGDIPFDETEEKVVIKKGSRTSVAEAFRLLRTNLDFMMTTVESKSKIIFVTSTISGEGKTFISVNAAASLALTGKKVLLMGMDLRAPKITQYLDLPNRSGVTNYIINKEDSLLELIKPLSGYENLDLLSSGAVPPNPAELLLSPKVSKMFTELKEVYDYIVVDTAPVNLVTDTLMLKDNADLFLYVSRSNYLEKRMLEVPERLYKDKRLPNMALLINGLDHGRGYGYGYGGYGYPSDNNKGNFISKLFKR